MTLERDLYALPPERFIAARDEAVARARADGDRAGAARIGALRRPTVAAWLVNLLALHRPEQVGELLDLGTRLREAQDQLSGERMRDLSSKRRAAISALVAQARRLAVEAGRRPRDPLPLAEVEATLGAAVADEEVAHAVRAGRLTKATGYAGFGEPLRPDLRVVDGGGQVRPARQRDAPAGARPARQRGDSGGAAGAETVAGRRSETGAGARGGARRRAGRAEPGESSGAGEASEAARRREREAAQRQREREEARAARTARIEAAEAALRDATAVERDATRALGEISAELDRLREAQVAAQAALRGARLARRAAERDVRRAGR